MTSSEARASSTRAPATAFVARNEFVHLLLGMERAGRALDAWTTSAEASPAEHSVVDDVTYAVLGLIAVRRTIARHLALATRDAIPAQGQPDSASPPSFHRGLLR